MQKFQFLSETVTLLKISVFLQEILLQMFTVLILYGDFTVKFVILHEQIL